MVEHSTYPQWKQVNENAILGRQNNTHLLFMTILVVSRYISQYKSIKSLPQFQVDTQTKKSTSMYVMNDI